MSANQWDWSLASADGLLTSNERSLLLEVDLLNTDEDLLKNFSGAGAKFGLGGYSVHDEFSNSLYPPSPAESKPSRAELANDLLQQLESQCKQENIFSNWLEEKVDLPIFENISQVPERVEVPQAIPVAPAPYAPQAVPQPTEELLREFETVYGAVELTHLTPPQSPPGPATQLLLSYAQHAQGVVPPPVGQPAAEHWPVVAAPALLPDYDCDSQALEELVRLRAAQLTSPQPSGDSSSGSPPSSPRSCSTDDEWAGSCRPKPYSRNVDDRRSRKKEQNKNAATRYRQKKKAEIEVLLNEEQNLRQHHAALGDKCADLQREIRYLKGLMRDLFRAKGLIK
ncbi:activating transcription factor of chaperone isoform X2 [Zerene cesonia]|uniref:activating transcription factor of chaperone isoform X1 n=1 Tax=Zerene cesonia TaxID=33412 RepID=UPI0018E4EB96|nr:activating transcription factor of chaperone isoform X1 [Zerene cesonia]XP_038206417.1 activating transcription factor of chaperone isoform X2 [Zerene cesonia]